MSVPLWKHQSEAIEKATDRYALHFDPGCGKSRTVIEILKKRIGERAGKELETNQKIVIFAPINVCRNWENELKLYWGGKYQTFLVAGGTKSKKIKTLGYFAVGSASTPSFLICNIEALRSAQYRAAISSSKAGYVVVDEAHNFKTPNSLQTKGLLQVEAALRPYGVYLLTGTPAPQGEIDLWTTMTLLKLTGDSFFLWRKKHFDDLNERRRGTQGYWPNYHVRSASRSVFQQLLAKQSMTARKDEVLDLPDLLRTNIYAEMSDVQQMHYDTMREFLFAVDCDGNELNAANLLTRTLRLQQILAGFLGDVPIADNPRVDALRCAIEKTRGSAPAQFIIWTIFQPTYGQIGELLDKLGISFGLLTGEQSPEERHETMAAFQSGELTALIAHPRAGGVGVNLTAASYSIHYTRSFNLVDDLQAEARNYRGGSEIHKRITRIDIITPDTIDEEISTALREKKNVQDFILGLKNNYRRAA